MFELSLPRATGLDMNSNRLPWSAPWMTNKEATRLSLLGSDATSRANHAQLAFKANAPDRRASTRRTRASDRRLAIEVSASTALAADAHRRRPASAASTSLASSSASGQLPQGDDKEPSAGATRRRAGAAGRLRACRKAVSGIAGVKMPQAMPAVPLDRLPAAARSRRRSHLHRRHVSAHAWRAPQVGQRMSSRDWIGIGLDRESP